MSDTVIIYTDGACSGNPGNGGWAFAMDNGATMYTEKGKVPNTTNNRMELQAAIEALKFCVQKGIRKVKILSDSKYVVDTMRNKWYLSWKPTRPNWDLWKELIELADAVEVEFEYTLAHTGNNLVVDKLAKGCARA